MIISVSEDWKSIVHHPSDLDVNWRPLVQVTLLDSNKMFKITKVFLHLSSCMPLTVNCIFSAGVWLATGVYVRPHQAYGVETKTTRTDVEDV